MGARRKEGYSKSEKSVNCNDIHIHSTSRRLKVSASSVTKSVTKTGREEVPTDRLREREGGGCPLTD